MKSATAGDSSAETLAVLMRSHSRRSLLFRSSTEPRRPSIQSFALTYTVWPLFEGGVLGDRGRAIERAYLRVPVAFCFVISIKSAAAMVEITVELV